MNVKIKNMYLKQKKTLVTVFCVKIIVDKEMCVISVN